MHQTLISKLGRAPIPPNYQKLMKEEVERKKPKISLRQLFFLKKKGYKKI